MIMRVPVTPCVKLLSEPTVALFLRQNDCQAANVRAVGALCGREIVEVPGTDPQIDVARHITGAAIDSIGAARTFYNP